MSAEGRSVVARNDMEARPKGWRSPKAWLTSAALIGSIWVAAYFFSQSLSVATGIAVLFVLIGLAGAFFT